MDQAAAAHFLDIAHKPIDTFYDRAYALTIGANMKDQTCNCFECVDSEITCFNDCGDCAGCYEAQRDAEETQYEIECAIGWR